MCINIVVNLYIEIRGELLGGRLLLVVIIGTKKKKNLNGKFKF